MATQETMYSSVAEGGPRRRNKIMCPQCRNDKQRCNPLDYNFDKGEKCERCKRMNHLCGLPIGAKEKKKSEHNAVAPALQAFQAASDRTTPI